MVVQGLVSIRDGRRNARYAAAYPAPSDVPPRTGSMVRVFCPIRGETPDLRRNLGSLLDQDHPRFRVTFIVDDVADPAHRVVAALARDSKADLVIAGPARARGQKVHNLAVAVERFGDAEVFAFADADARFPRWWLRALTDPLGPVPGEGSPLPIPKPAAIGATTGYRWYVAPRARERDVSRGVYWATSFRSAWNASVAGFLGPGPNNFAWGGSMAIRRDVYEGAGVAGFWENALSDDFALTSAVRAAGLRVVFVPTCLVPSSETCGWRELWEFSTRQMRITRVYSPGIWKVALASYSLFTGTLVALAFSVVSGPAPAAFWIVLVGLAAVRADYRLVAARRSIDDPSLRGRRWFYRLAAPLLAFLYLGNLLAAAGSRRIVWKGVTYRMDSPRRTIIEDRGRG
jgi:cellulose synthase/poly-beta-1,6-N-acetylglucosamine synthase-like glycosyltransferase